MSLKVDLLAESFAIVLSQKEAFAETFYSNLFAEYPQTRPLFKDTNMKQQEMSLVAAIGLVISSLKKSDYQQLASVLQKLGQRHEGYGVTSEQYMMVGNVLLRTFAVFLGNQWTAELNDTWADAYQAVVGMMLPVAQSA
jgi:hemoglobin-like flavoprotein